MEKLCFVRKVGQEFDGQNLYEVFFTKDPEEYFEIGWVNHQWDSQPSQGRPELHRKGLTSVGSISTDILLDLVMDSMSFDMLDTRDGVVSMAWENTDSYTEEQYPQKRMVFPYGMDKDKFEETLYQREITPKYKQYKHG
jgi:hypothetical protein